MAITISQSDRNLIPNNWSLGVGSEGVFSANGSTYENERQSGTSPFGQDIVWTTHPLGNSDADGGWNTSQFDINPSRMYRFSVWVRRNSATTGGTCYFGMYGSNSAAIQMADNVAQGNPYWECQNISFITQNVWYLLVGHVYPWDTLYTGRHPDTGRYTIASGKVADIGGCNIGGGDLKWAPNGRTAQHRAYHYYCPDNTSSISFWGARVDLCDGTEPSIADLLSNNTSTHSISMPGGSNLTLNESFRNSSLIKTTTFTSSGTWTKQPQTRKIMVQVVGGGGGAAGYCESGGAGGFAERAMDATSMTSVSVTIGGGGGNVGYYAAAGDGGTSSFGSYISATGGYGANRNYSHTGGVGGIGSGGQINLYGSTGTGHANSAGHGAIGRGGRSFWGGSSGNNRAGGGRVSNGAPGSGGPGGRTDESWAGGPGESGAVVIWEYS